MNGQNFLLQDGMRGLMILKRPAEIQQIKESRILPFVSRVTSKTPVGLPPIMNNVVCNKNKNQDSTKLLLKQLHKYPRKGDKKRKIKLCKLLKEVKTNRETDRERDRDRDRDRDTIIKEESGIQNNQDSIDIVLEKSHSQSKLEKEFQSSHLIKIEDEGSQNLNENINENSKQPSISLVEKLKQEVKKQNFLEEENDNDDEVNKMLDFVNNLDYDRYKNDLEVRENLYVIKNQIEKETSKYNSQTEVMPEITQDKDNPKEEDKISSSENFDKVTLFHDKDWDNSVFKYLIKIKPEKQNQNYDEEYLKKTIAKTLLKEDKNLRVVHSLNSLKKLLEREGLVEPTKINTLKISIIKERDGIHMYEYKPSVLPNLRDLPII